MSAIYEEEQAKIKERITELQIQMSTKASQITNTERFLAIIRRYTDVQSLDRGIVSDNARQFQNQREYQQKYDDLNDRYEKVKLRLVEVAAERQSRMARREQIQRFIDAVQSRGVLLCEFDESLWRAMVESVKVKNLADIRVRFRDGREISANMSQK